MMRYTIIFLAAAVLLAAQNSALADEKFWALCRLELKTNGKSQFIQAQCKALAGKRSGSTTFSGNHEHFDIMKTMTKRALTCLVVIKPNMTGLTKCR